MTMTYTAFLTAAVVPNEEAMKYSSSGSDDAAVKASKRADPELFQLSLTGVRPGDRLRVSLTWFQPLVLVNGQYMLRVSRPAYFQSNHKLVCCLRAQHDGWCVLVIRLSSLSNAILPCATWWRTHLSASQFCQKQRRSRATQANDPANAVPGANDDPSGLPGPGSAIAVQAPGRHLHHRHRLRAARQVSCNPLPGGL